MTGPAEPPGARPVTAQTLDRGIQVLELIAASPVDLSAADVAAGLQLHRTVVHRLLATLEARQLVARHSGGRYRLGWGLLRLSGPMESQLRQIARPTLRELNRLTDETVHLVVLTGSEVLYIDVFESTRPLRVASRVGRTLPAHATSVGRALLAQLPEEVVLKMYPETQLEEVGPGTPRRRSVLLGELAQVRAQGFAISIEGVEVGVGSIGAAICDANGYPHAALSIAAPTARLTHDARERFAAAATAAAAQIGSNL